MAGIDLRYYDQLTDTWIAPLANGEDLKAVQVLITQLGQDVGTAVEEVGEAVSAVETAVETVGTMQQTVTTLQQTVTQNQQVVTEHLAESKAYVIARKNTNQTLQSGIETPLTFATLATNVVNDYCALESNGQIKILKKGIYHIMLNVQFVTSANGDRNIVPHDSEYAVSTKATADIPTRLQSSLLRYVFNANTILNLRAYQSSGSALDVTTSTSVTIVKVGDLA